MKVSLFLLAIVGSAFAEIYFEDRFDKDDWESRWVQSTHKGAEAGKFVWTAGKFYGDAEKDKGIQTSQDAKFYALSSEFKPASTQEKPLVVQFTVKHEQNIDCGGGYAKLFDCSLDQTDMHGESPYKIMFGPDICGPGTKKVHVIFNYKEENHLIKKEIRCKDDVFTHLYTLILQPDGTYEVLIDNESAQKGSLDEDWDFLPPKMIKDPEASKPEDWDDRAKIDDPEDSKPEDWDQPEHIADPDATKPEDWDDEMDGEWEPPMVDNPEFKGDWKAPMMKNPAYKGKWVHPEIDNPDYAADSEIYAYDDFGRIGLDLWQVKSGTIFSNFLITDELEVADAQAKELLKLIEEESATKKAEEEAAAAAEPEADDELDDDEEGEIDADDDEDYEDLAHDLDDLLDEGHDEL